jgi:dTDP-4-dehydrorhamnose reductase
MTILIFGASGQLGHELIRQSQLSQRPVNAPTRSQFDITQISEVKEAFAKFCPSIVINAAAYTDVDGAESEAERAYGINKAGAENLARNCAKLQIPLVHVSTDYVFDGSKGTPYVETDPITPLGVYGRSKAEGDDIIRAALPEHIIVRTSWLYSGHANNFVTTILSLGRQKKELDVVADQFGSPTSATDLAEVLLHLASQVLNRSEIPWGTYHYCGEGVTTWYEFANSIFKIAGQHECFQLTRLNPITTEEFPTAAQRPQNSSLDCGRIEQKFGIHPKPWQISLSLVIEQVYRKQKNLYKK